MLAINRAIAAAREYDEVLRLVVDRIASYTGADACLLLLSRGGGPARIVRSVGLDPEKAARVELPLLEGAGAALCDVLGLKRECRFVGAPVIGSQGVIGILAAYWERTHDGEWDEELLSGFADQAAIAIENSERMRRLRTSEEKLAGIISIAADGIITVDEEQRIVMFNEGAEKIFGWSRAEVLGQPLDILLAERHRDIHHRLVKAFGEGRETARRTAERTRAIFGVRKNGEEFPAEAAVSKLNVDGGWLFTVVLRDATERKRVEHEETFLAEMGAVLAATLDPEETLANIGQLTLREFADLCIVEFVDDDGQIHRLAAMTSDPARKEFADGLLNFPLDRTRPHLTTSIVQNMEPKLIPEVTEETLRAISQTPEHRRLIDGIGPRSIMGAPLMAHGRSLGALVVASTRPDRRYGPNDLRFLEEIARRGALALENARLYRAMQRAVQARDDVLGIVAHDLRNPLNTILMQAALLRRLRPETERRTREPGEVIERAAVRMNRLIQDLLDVTRMDAGRLSMDRQRLPAAQLVIDSLENEQALAASGSVELQVDIAPLLPDIWADRDRLLQVFENLIGNATRYTPPGGRITVGARAEDGEVVFRISDTGAGIRAEDVPHLFDRFWQARKERRGAGLGLAIVKGIVEAHGGRVWVQSAPGTGSTFWFTVPAAPAQQVSAGGAAMPAGA